MLPSKIPRLSTDPPVRGFLVFGNLSSFKTPFLGRICIPNSFVPLFIFYIFSYLLSKIMGCFPGCLISSAGIQKLFYGIYSALKCSFDEFVGKKVFSLLYSSDILGLPPVWWVLIMFLHLLSISLLFRLLRLGYPFFRLEFHGSS